MINITLMDGQVKSFDAPLSVLDLAKHISPSLAKKALAGKLIRNGQEKMVDLEYVLTADTQVAIITPKDKEALPLIRHSTAHLLAQAVKELYPDVKLTIGPAIENGFYYDFSYKRPFTPEDLETIEARMHEILRRNEHVTREEWPRQKALTYFGGINEDYKVELINDLGDDETISVYQQGQWIELCRGPHVPNVSYCKVFKLMHVAGAYWRGNSDNEMLQRIYGTAWFTQKEQDAYLKMLEEAELRDHRRLAKELDLFHLQEEGPGLIFWHPRGWSIWQQIEQYIRKVYEDNGYQEVKTPQILDISLWKKTGHWDNYKENMFVTESESRVYGLKPMNCPGHVQIFNAGLHSYRELPLRYGEFGQCHRNEPSGSLHGIMRVRGFTQDDGHIFCTEDQLQSECAAFTQLLQKVYRDFGFTEVLYKVATRPEKRIGADEIWDKAEKALMDSLDASGCEYEVSPGEGAFYGPKIEYTLKDAIGRHWQCGTIQVDFSMPQRLGAEYVDSDDQRKTPVMLHRAILGSLERFIGVLIENHAGAMPVWLSPEQVAVCPIAESFHDYSSEVAQKLRDRGFRVVLDTRNEKINRKIRENMMRKIPYVLVIGEKEVNTGTVSIRARGNLNLGVVSVDEFISRLSDDVTEHRNTIVK